MKILRNKTVAKIIALLIAIIVWVAVIVTQDPEETSTIHNIPITWMNEEILEQNGFTFMGANVETAGVTVRGYRSIINEYSDYITLQANVNINAAGRQYVSITPVLPIGVALEVVSIRPAGVTIFVEDIITRSHLINIVYSGDKLPDTEPGNIVQHPERIEISGARSLVEQVQYVEVEIPFHQISRVSSRFTLEVQVLDADRNPIPNLTLTTRLAGVDIMLYDVMEIPISLEILGEVSAKYVITELYVPQTVRVRGTRLELATLERIEAEPIDITGVERTSSLRVQFSLPEGLALAVGQTHPHVRIELETLANTSFEFDSQEIEIDGLEAGLVAQFEEFTLSLVVAGDDEIIEEATKEDFRLLVNLEGLEPGTHMVPIIVIHENDIRFWEVVPVEVEVEVVIASE